MKDDVKDYIFIYIYILFFIIIDNMGNLVFDIERFKDIVFFKGLDFG